MAQFWGSLYLDTGYEMEFKGLDTQNVVIDIHKGNKKYQVLTMKHPKTLNNILFVMFLITIFSCDKKSKSSYGKSIENILAGDSCKVWLHAEQESMKFPCYGIVFCRDSSIYRYRYGVNNVKERTGNSDIVYCERWWMKNDTLYFCDQPVYIHYANEDVIIYSQKQNRGPLYTIMKNKDQKPIKQKKER